MHPLHFAVLADENIHETVVHFLRSQNVIIESIKEKRLQGATDNQIIRLAEQENKIILTHDADFGRIMHLTPGLKTGIIFLRPGHLDFTIDIQTIKGILNTEIDVEIPFILVVERTNNDIKIRLRSL